LAPWIQLFLSYLIILRGRCFIGNIKKYWRQAEASTLIINLLEEYKKTNPVFSADTNGSGNLFVQNVWNERPDIFDGKFGQRPNKITVATRALAKAIDEIPDNAKNKVGVLWALTFLLEEIQINGKLYPFNSLDWQLIDESNQILKVYTERIVNGG